MPSFSELQGQRDTVWFMLDGELIESTGWRIELAYDPAMPPVGPCYRKGQEMGASYMVKPLRWGRKGIVTMWGVYKLDAAVGGGIDPTKFFPDYPLEGVAMWCRHMEASECS